MPPLTPYTSLDKHFRYIKSLLPANDPSPVFRRASAAPASRVEVYTSAVHKARYSSRELDESEFTGAMEAGEWLLGVCVLVWRSTMTSVENRNILQSQSLSERAARPEFNLTSVPEGRNCEVCPQECEYNLLVNGII